MFNFRCHRSSPHRCWTHCRMAMSTYLFFGVSRFRHLYCHDGSFWCQLPSTLLGCPRYFPAFSSRPPRGCSSCVLHQEWLSRCSILQGDKWEVFVTDYVVSKLFYNLSTSFWLKPFNVVILYCTSSGGKVRAFCINMKVWNSLSCLKRVFELSSWSLL